MGMFQNLKKVALGAVALVSGLFASASHAAPVDLTSLSTAVDFSTTTTAVLGVASALIVVYIAWKAAKMVIGALRGM